MSQSETPLRVLILPGRDPYGADAMGGAESSMRLLGEMLAARGHDVWIAARDVSDATQQVARQAGITLVEWSVPSWVPKATHGRAEALLLARIAKRHGSQMVYCFYDRRVLRAAAALRRRHDNLRLMVRMAGLRWAVETERRPARGRDYAKGFASADSVNFIHPALEKMTAQEATRLGLTLTFRDTLVKDIGSSHPIGRTTPYAPVSADGRVNVVMAARFSDYQKRQDLLVEAMALLPADSPVTLTLVGEGRQRAAAEARVGELNLSDRVHILPFEAQDALWQRMQGAQLLALATDFEGLGKIVVEAMAMGLPVLASDVRPLSDYLDEGQTGFLVQNTAQDWAARLGALATPDTADLRRAVSRNAVAHAQAAFDPTRNVKDYETAFKRLTGTAASDTL